MHPKDLSIKDFTYTLPEERIAHYPLEERDSSKLIIYKNENIAEDVYKNIADHIPENSLLVFNNSKVIEARILFQKITGGVIEIFCLEPGSQYADITSAMLQQGSVHWHCLVGGASKWKHGQQLKKEIKTKDGTITLYASYVEKKAGSFVIELSWRPSHLSFAEVLHLAGAIPLPPYIKRNVEESDAERYQTIYAQHNGSVAAPTAGLHFTADIFKSFSSKNIQADFLTLHVGAGTFKPVKTETMEAHEMHAEYIEVSRETILKLISSIDSIIAVGTTSLRTLESLYWLGVKVSELPIAIGTGVGSQESKVNSLPIAIGMSLSQWEAYELNGQYSAIKSLKSLLVWMDENKTDRLLAKTQIIIAPGYKPRIVKALVTNFHQPQSTLLLLIAALIGEKWKEVYQYALEHDFRFLSYGDGCLLWISP